MPQYTTDPLQTIVVKLTIDPSLVFKEIGCSRKGQPLTQIEREAIYRINRKV